MDTLACHWSYAPGRDHANSVAQRAGLSDGKAPIACYRKNEWVSVETVTQFAVDCARGEPAAAVAGMGGRSRGTLATYSPELLPRTAPSRTPVILFALDPAGRVVQACGEWHGALGLDLRTIIGRNSQDLFRQEPAILESLARALKGEDLCRELTCQESTIEFRFSAVRSESGQVLSVIGAAADVTKRKRLESELQSRDAELAHAARLKSMGEFMAGITHEINQPLHAIATFASACQKALEAESISAADLLHWTRQISKQTRRVEAIIERLGRFCRRNVSQATSSLDLNELIHETLDMLASEIRRQKIRLHLNLASRMPRVDGDEVQIAQLLLNLMRNAIDAMAEVPPARRQLRLGTAVAAPWIEVSVEDSGMGFVQELAEQIFEPFHTTKPNGMGMGLAICRSIAEAHRGRLLASSSQGQGATFCLQLPLTTQSDIHEDSAHGVRGR